MSLVACVAPERVPVHPRALGPARAPQTRAPPYPKASPPRPSARGLEVRPKSPYCSPDDCSASQPDSAQGAQSRACLTPNSPEPMARGWRPGLFWSAERWLESQVIMPPRPCQAPAPRPNRPQRCHPPEITRRPSRQTLRPQIERYHQGSQATRASAPHYPGEHGSLRHRCDFTNIILLSPGQDAAFTTEQNWRLGLGGKVSCWGWGRDGLGNPGQQCCWGERTSSHRQGMAV